MSDYSLADLAADMRAAEEEQIRDKVEDHYGRQPTSAELSEITRLMYRGFLSMDQAIDEVVVET